MAKVKVYYNRGVGSPLEAKYEDPANTGIAYEKFGSGDICFHMKRERIPESGPRPRAIWDLSDNREELYFTCPWCGGANLVSEETLGRKPSLCEDRYDCLWCMRCERHLWARFLPQVIVPESPVQPLSKRRKSGRS